MTAAILNEDAAAFGKYIVYPYEIRTMDGAILCQDEVDLSRTFSCFGAQLKQDHVTNMIRTCDAARFVTRDHILGHHTSRVMSKDQEVVPPYVTRLGLYQSADGHWRANTSETVISAQDWALVPNWVKATSGRFFEKPVTQAKQRLKLFQTILDRISAAYLSDDVEALINATALPFQLITRQGVETFRTEAEMRRDFDRYQQEFRAHGVTDLVREAKTAEIVDGDQMVGTFTTHILNRARHVVPPWDASMTLRRENGIWRATSIMRAIGHLNWSAQSRAEIEDIPPDTPKKGDPK